MSKSKKLTYTPRSVSELRLRVDTNSSKSTEKDYESIGEESQPQAIQASIMKRDKSASVLKDLPRRDFSINEEITRLESDLSSLRGQYLVMIEEKLKVEKEVVFQKSKLKILEKKSEKDAEKIAALEKTLKNLQGVEKKYVEASERFKDANEKLKDMFGMVESDKNEQQKVLTMYESRLNRLTKENISLKQQLLSKDNLYEKLQSELETLKSSDVHESRTKALKTLSGIILSKDSKPAKKLKDLETNFTQLFEQHQSLLQKNKNLTEFVEFLSGLIKEEEFGQARNVIAEHELGGSFSPDLSRSVSGSPSKKSEENELAKTVEALHEKIEALEMKLELGNCHKDFLGFIQCQASIIEDYLNEDAEISQINSSLFSI